MAKVLIIRLSALGDVAMLVPVVASVAWRYPQDRFYVMTRAAFAPLFNSLSFNIGVIPIDTKKKHKGIFGLLRIVTSCLFSEFTHVADVHDVLRSKIIRWALLLTGRKTRHIDKGREEKKQMIQSKELYPLLKHSTMRYLDVFNRLGLPADIMFTNSLDFAPKDLNILKSIAGKKTGTWIGVAPFARHKGKMYPLQKMEKVVETLSKEGNTTVLLLGAGDFERDVLNKWADKYENIVDLSGKLNLDKELLVMSYMDVVISMDSANMHLASLVQTPVVSIWGATHPSLGFYGFKQDFDNAVQIEGLYCRPCSAFGDLPCSDNGSYKCMNSISEQMIIDKVHAVLKQAKEKTD